MGTADFGVPALTALAQSRHDLVAVYTQPARKAGRGMKPRSTPIAEAAGGLAVPVFSPKTLRAEDVQAEFASLGLDLAVVAAYGLILPQAILDIPRRGCLNLHASALPRWRGAAPIQRAILAGDRETGITLMQMAAGLDTGPMLRLERLAIGPDEDAGALHDRLAALAAEMVLPVVDALASGQIEAEPQPDDGVTYAHKIEKDEARIDWREDADAVARRVRAFNPVPGAWTELGDERLRIRAGRVVAGTGEPGTVLDDALTIACGEGAYRPTLLQRAGARPLPPDAFLRGHPVPAGTRLGTSCPASS